MVPKINIIKTIAINMNIAKSSFVRMGEKQNIESMAAKANNHYYVFFPSSTSSLCFWRAG